MNKLKNIGMVLSGVSLLVLGVYYIIESVSLGAELAKIQREERKLVEENRDLSDSLIGSSSLSSFEKKTEELGFLKPESVVYLKGETQVANLPVK